VQTKKRLLRDLLGQRVPATHGAEVAKDRIVEF
jgi:hypothetical protein